MPPFREIAARPETPERNLGHDLQDSVGVAELIEAEVECGPDICGLSSQSRQPIHLPLRDPLRLRGPNKRRTPLQVAHLEFWYATGLVQPLQSEFTDGFQ